MRGTSRISARTWIRGSLTSGYYQSLRYLMKNATERITAVFPWPAKPDDGV